MQLTRIAVILGLAAAGLATPSQAGLACTLLPLVSGTLKLSASGGVLGSEEPGGVAATLSIVSIGSSTVTISAPVLAQYPPAHSLAGDVPEVAYRGTDLLSSVVQPYTGSASQFSVPNLLSAVVVVLNNRVRTTTGFAPGSYQTRTVVTCS